MPGEEAAYLDEELDLYPKTDDEHRKLLSWCHQALDAAVRHRDSRERKWKRDYKLYRSYVPPRKPGEWRSRMFIPESFRSIETILPRLVAELPKFMVLPHGPEDVEPSKIMQELVDYSVRNSRLYLELVKSYKDMLVFGTGILKTYYDEIPGYGSRPEPVMQRNTETITETVVDPETGQPLRGPDGEVVTQPKEVSYDVPLGFRKKRFRFPRYEGPMAKCIDPFNLWPAPEATSPDDARYLIHRSFRELSDVKRLVKKGIYTLPDGVDDDSFFENAELQPHLERLDSIDLGPSDNDPSRKQVELHEFWINDGPDFPGRLVTMANKSIILRVQENPFDHGQFPFVFFHNYLQSHEFWGVSEIENIEGLQDFINAVVNQRVDNMRLGMDQGWVVNTHQLEDRRQLTRRPGQVIEIKGDGMMPKDVMDPIPTQEVTQSAFVEVEHARSVLEATTGATALQQGSGGEGYTDTASGIAQILEQGSSRFALKTRVNEIDGLARLGMQYGTNIQQFLSEERVVRLSGPAAETLFATLDPLSIQGAFDFEIASESIMQSETMKREQIMTLWRLTVEAVTNQALPPQAATVAFMDVLEAFNIKDKEKYLYGLGAPSAAGQQGPEQLGDMSTPASDMGQQQGMQQ